MIVIPPRPHWGKLLDQTNTPEDFAYVAYLMWVPVERKGMADRVGALLASENRAIAALAEVWLHCPDPTPCEWVERS